MTVDDLLDAEGYDAVFVGSGAAAPALHGHTRAENLNGVYSPTSF